MYLQDSDTIRVLIVRIILLFGLTGLIAFYLPIPSSSSSSSIVNKAFQ